jgi:hypothetical protein
MRRREFMAGLLGATSVRAEERPRIAVLHSGFPNRTPIHLLFEAFSCAPTR